MVSFTSLLLAVSTAVGAFALPSDLAARAPGTLMKRQKTANSAGTHDGFYYSWWSDGGASLAEYTNLAGGEFRIRWGNGGNLVGGKGWNPGTNRVITYSGTYSYQGNSYLAVYGWTKNPLIEYYVVENFGSYNPSSGASRRGTVTSDGGTYDVLVSTRNQQPSIIGTATFQQYWSVRQQKRTGGTVNMDTHFKAWNSMIGSMGAHDYQVVACEGYFSSGQCQIKVSEGSGGGGGNPTQPQQPTSTQNNQQPTQPPNNGGGGGNCAAKWGQCGGQGYNGPTCCQSGSTCNAQNQWYSQCI